MVHGKGLTLLFGWFGFLCMGWTGFGWLVQKCTEQKRSDVKVTKGRPQCARQRQHNAAIKSQILSKQQSNQAHRQSKTPNDQILLMANEGKVVPHSCIAALKRHPTHKTNHACFAWLMIIRALHSPSQQPTTNSTHGLQRHASNSFATNIYEPTSKALRQKPDRCIQTQPHKPKQKQSVHEC